MRVFTIVLVALLVLIQYPLWLGKGSWLRVWDVERQLAQQQQVNARLRERNGSLEAEVRDLRQGTGAIEERARYELGMIRPDEIFVQVGEPGAAPAAALLSAAPMPGGLSGASSSPARSAR
jgi:cell division protein FtsB